MRHILFFLAFAILIITTNGQTKNGFDMGKPPYVLVDTFTVDIKYLIINPSNILSVDVIKNSNAIKMYGDKAINGAVIIKTKPNTSLLQINNILDKYSIGQTERKLRICIDKTLISNPTLILIEESEIKDVTITTERHWINAEDANSNERFINISTKQSSKNGL